MHINGDIRKLDEAFAGVTARDLEFIDARVPVPGESRQCLAAPAEPFEMEHLEPRILLSATDPSGLIEEADSGPQVVEQIGFDTDAESSFLNGSAEGLDALSYAPEVDESDLFKTLDADGSDPANPDGRATRVRAAFDYCLETGQGFQGSGAQAFIHGNRCLDF